jgi:hypothetical protein
MPAKTIEDVLTAAGNADEAFDYFLSANAPDGSMLIYVDQFGKDPKSAEAEIRKGVKDERLVKALLAAWTEAQPKPDTPVVPPVTPVKTITRGDPPPPGTVDITSSTWPTLTSRTDLETIQFRIPDLLRASGPTPQPVSFANLQWTDWIHVARLCNLTKAVRLDAVYVGTHSILPDGVALRWRPEPAPGFVDDVTPGDLADGGISTQLSFTAEEHSAFKQGVFSNATDGGFWFISASASVSRKAKLATNSRKRRLYMALKDVHPVCRLHLRECLEASDELKDAVTKALGAGDDWQAFNLLLKVVERFGHAVPQTLVLGGLFVFENTKNIKSWDRNSEAELKSRIEVSLKQAAASPTGTTPPPPTPHGGTATTYDDDDKDWASKDGLSQNMHAYPVGGNMNMRDPEAWRATVINPEDWRVILRESGMLSVFEFLPKDLKASVDRVWEAGRKTAWGYDAARKFNKIPDTLDFSVPLFWTASGVRQVTLFHSQSQLLLQAKNGVTAKIPAHEPHVIPARSRTDRLRNRTVSVPEQRFDILPIETAAPGRFSGTHWTHCDAAPVGLPAHMAADAHESEALWRFEFSGDITQDGDPLYWVVSQDGALKLSAFDDQRNKKPWAKLVPRPGDAVLPGSNMAAWVIYPADPTGLRGDAFASSFLFWNPVAKGFLGQRIDLVGHKGWVEEAHEEQSVRDRSVDPRVHEYYIERYHIDRRETSDGTEAMQRFSVVPSPAGIKDVYDLPDPDFLKLCWDVKPPR